jgi:ABC-type multidrug transport system fused ATPase/permease subunit
MIRKFSSRPAISIVLIVGVIIAAFGYIDQPIRMLGMGEISKANEAYLKNSFDKAITGFLILSGIKSGLAVLEGSEVGVGFNLEIGDIVQSVYDYVDVAWKTALLGATVILITRLMLQSAEMIDHWCLTFLLFTVFISLIIKWVFPKLSMASRIIRETTFYLIVFSVVLYLVLPLSIISAAFLSEKITRPLIEESQNSFENIKEDFSINGINRQIFSNDQKAEGSWIFDLNIKAQLEKIKARINLLADYFKDKSKNVAIWTIQLIAGYLFDSIIFPITFFILLFIVAKSILMYLFEDRKHRSLKEDIAEMIEKYYGIHQKKTPYHAYRLKFLRKVRR